MSGSTGYRRSTTPPHALQTEPAQAPGNPDTGPRVTADLLRRARDHVHKFDVQQEVIAKQIAPGPQRIRGIAGSGKTVLLCQKAVQMHLKHPDWDIGLVFFTRSLYDLMLSTIDRWMLRFSHGDLNYDPKTSRLQVLHAWGAKDQLGFYRRLAVAADERPLTANDAPHRLSPTASYAWVLNSFIDQLEKSDKAVPRLFDALLVDEGQDLVFDMKFVSGDRQPFYWLAYEALRPAKTPDNQHGLSDEPEEAPARQEYRRLVWAYDEAQSLDSLTVPTYKEVFGAEVAERMSASGPRYPGGISKNEVMGRCYRSPGPILAAAHAIGMGLLRPTGMLYGVTNKRNWNMLGYDVEGEFRSGRFITLTRRPDATPNIVPKLSDGSVVTFKNHVSRQDEIAYVAEQVKNDIRKGCLEPSRDLLVIALGNAGTAKTIQREFAQALYDRGIDYFIPSATAANTLLPKYPDKDPNAFWHKGAVTVSTLFPAKGNEADVVYILGLDEVAKREDDAHYRNQVFVALTRARAFAHLNGVGKHAFFEEVREVLASGTKFSFTFRYPYRLFDEALEIEPNEPLGHDVQRPSAEPAIAIGRNSRTVRPK